MKEEGATSWSSETDDADDDDKTISAFQTVYNLFPITSEY